MGKVFLGRSNPKKVLFFLLEGYSVDKGGQGQTEWF